MAIEKIEKKIIGNLSFLVSEINGQKTYTLETALKPGSFTISRLDAQLIIPHGIVGGAKLTMERIHSVIVKGDVSGTIVVTNSVEDKTTELLIHGNVKKKAEIHCFSNVNCTIMGEVEPETKVYGKGKLVCNGIVCDRAILKAKSIRFNGYIDKQAFGYAEEITVDIRFYTNVKSGNFSYQKISTFTEEYELIDADNSDEWSQLASTIEKGTEHFAQQSDNVSNDNQVKQISSQNSISGVNDNKMQMEFGPKKTAKVNLNKRNATSMEKSVVDAQATFLYRKEKLIQRMSDFCQELLKTKKLVTSNGKTIDLWEHQINDLQSLIKHYKEGKFNGFFKNATGTGKTIEILLFYIAMNTCNNATVMDVPLLIIVSRTSLIKQTIEEFTKYYPWLNTGVVDGNHRKIGKHVTITTYDSFRIQMQKKDGDSDKIIYPEKFGFVVADEAHHIGTKGVHPQIPLFFRYVPVLGMSATVVRSEPEPGALKFVAEVLPTCYGQFDITKGIDKGVLAPVHVAIVHVHTTTKMQGLRRNGTVSKHFNGFADYRDDELAAVLNVEKINRIIVELLGNGVFRGKRICQFRGLVSAVTVEHARQIAAEINKYLENLPEFKEKSITPAAVVHGEMSPSERERISYQHDTGELPIVCFCDAWSEGVNFPVDAILINARPIPDLGGSEITAQQRGGRLLRKAQNKVALVIDLVYGPRQITFNHYLNGKCTYGKMPELINKEYSTENLIYFSEDEIESYRVDSEYFFVAKAGAPKLTIQTKACESETPTQVQQSFQEDDSYLYNVEELGYEIPRPVQETKVLEEGEILETSESGVTNKYCSMFQSPKRQRIVSTTTTMTQEDHTIQLSS